MVQFTHIINGYFSDLFVMTSCQLDPKEQTVAKVESQYESFFKETPLENAVCEPAIICFKPQCVNKF